MIQTAEGSNCQQTALPRRSHEIQTKDDSVRDEPRGMYASQTSRQSFHTTMMWPHNPQQPRRQTSNKVSSNLRQRDRHHQQPTPVTTILSGRISHPPKRYGHPQMGMWWDAYAWDCSLRQQLTASLWSAFMTLHGRCIWQSLDLNIVDCVSGVPPTLDTCNKWCFLNPFNPATGHA